MHLPVPAPKTSLLVSTYNWKDALDATLGSVLRQSALPDEVLVADDGSRDDTRALVRSWAARLPVPLRHVWQEDDGFRLAQIRNRAIAAATGEYVIQTDGDVVLHRHFVRDHLRLAERGHFVRGNRCSLPPGLSGEFLAGRVRSPLWSLEPVLKRKNALRLAPLIPLLARRVPFRGVIGCNMSYWRSDAIAVNGYDEAIRGWGLEDDEFVQRLLNAGVRHKALALGGVLYHLWHRESVRTTLDANRRVLDETRAAGRVRCERGVAQYL
jgi:glycosyltransferase involved in cell wall biosynthesis